MGKKLEYIQRVNAAIDYIEKNIANPIRLEAIASAAGLSPFHFHRIFKSETGEGLNSFVRRIRCEKAAFMLCYNPGYSITRISFINGYSSSQAFAREFKVLYGQTPQQFRQSKICHSDSKFRKDYQLSVDYDGGNRRPSIRFKSLTIKDMKVEIKELPDMTLAYLRHVGPYKGDVALFDRLFGRLCSWAGARKLIDQDTKYLCIYYEGPEVTDAAKLRLDVCLNVPAGTEVGGDIGKQELKGGTYAIARCTINSPKDYEKYWNDLYANWLPGSGYQPDNKTPFEMYPADCKLPGGGMIVDICIPVLPA